MSESLHYFLVAAITFAVFCRARKMGPCTPAWVKVQNGLSMILAMLSLPAYRLESAPALLSLALFVYIAFDAVKWTRLDNCR